MPSPLNLGIFRARFRASCLSSTSAWRDPRVLVFPTAAAEFVRNSFTTRFWLSNCADCNHLFSWRRSRSNAGARTLRHLARRRCAQASFSAVTTRARCNSLSTNGSREGLRVRARTTHQTAPLLALAQIPSWTESGPLSSNSSELVRLTRRMSASPAADGLRSFQGGGRPQDGLIHV